MNPSLATRIAALFGFFAVALGAFGAHGLAARLAQNGTAAIWSTAALYHLTHAVVLLVLAQGIRGRSAAGPFLCFAIGIVIFSGSLYLLAMTNQRWLGAVTPLGGWLATARRSPCSRSPRRARYATSWR